MTLSAVFQALSDPHRRHILRLLSQGERSAGDLAAELPLTKPSVSHHLSVLRHAGLVRDERRGQRIVYWLDTTVLQDALRWALDLGVVAGDGGGGGGDDGRRDAEGSWPPPPAERSGGPSGKEAGRDV